MILTRLAILFFLLPKAISCLPQDPVVVAGSAEISQSGSSMQVQAASDRTIVNWSSFSIESGEMAQFIQPSASSAVLNRVTGSNLTEIMGLLQSNGKIYLINPHGVIISSGAIIDTAAFIASTYPVYNEDFLENTDLLLKGHSTASIIHLGTIQANDGPVALIAHRIENDGEISSLGTVSLAAGHEILLKPSGDTLLHIRPKMMKGGGIEQSGAIEALKTIIKADGTYSLGIQQSGSIDALNLAHEGGQIILKAPGGPIEISGCLTGSDIHLTGNQVDILSESFIGAPQGKITIVTEGGPLYQSGFLSAAHVELTVAEGNERPVYQFGTIDVEPGGSIQIAAPKCIQSGRLYTKGGSISIQTSGDFSELKSGILSVSHEEADAGLIKISGGAIYTSGNHRAVGGHRGGRIHLLGEKISLAGATIDASGGIQGGEILIGGDLNGKNPLIPNAEETFLNPSVKLLADSQNGPGGKIVVWSKEKTEQYGKLSAAGTEEGTIQVSSRGKTILKEISESAPKTPPSKKKKQSGHG